MFTGCLRPVLVVVETPKVKMGKGEIGHSFDGFLKEVSGCLGLALLKLHQRQIVVVTAILRIEMDRASQFLFSVAELPEGKMGDSKEMVEPRIARREVNDLLCRS